MAAVLSLILSMLVTAALLGWLVSEGDRPAPERGRAGRRRGADPSGGDAAGNPRAPGFPARD